MIIQGILYCIAGGTVVSLLLLSIIEYWYSRKLFRWWDSSNIEEQKELLDELERQRDLEQNTPFRVDRPSSLRKIHKGGV